MADIPNTEYITINKDDVFVGGKPATTYRGEKIYDINLVQSYFVDILKLNPDVTELHVLSSETSGEYAKVGNPSGNHGPNAWCRAKFNDGYIGSWVFYNTACSAALCAYYCAHYCAPNVRCNADFRSAVLGAVIDKQNALTNALKDTDLSKLVGKPVQLNGYEIVVRKIAETQQIKR